MKQFALSVIRRLPPESQREIRAIYRRLSGKESLSEIERVHNKIAGLEYEVRSLRMELRAALQNGAVAPPIGEALHPARGNAERLFPLADVLAWLRELKKSGISFIFPEELDAHSGSEVGLAVLKHDIHHNVERCERLAEKQSEIGVKAAYMIMGPHVVNRSIINRPETWLSLQRIEKMGHRVGLHLDVIDSILKHGDLNEAIAGQLALFKSHNLNPHYGNSHGNSKYKSFGVQARDFFVETARPKPVSLNLPEGEGHLLDHWAKYSLAEIGDRFGLQYWLDGTVLKRGQPLNGIRYVSDNSGKIVVSGVDLRSSPFRIDQTFVKQSAQVLRDSLSLILLHPQWIDASEQSAAIPSQSNSTSNLASPQLSSKAHFDPTRFPSVSAIRFSDVGTQDISVTVDGLRYDCRLNRRATAKHLIVALHGGVRGAKALPVLARWTQHNYFKAPILSVFDPLVYEHPHIPGGWFVGDRRRDATKILAEIAAKTAHELGLTEREIVFLGNSGGGFGAVRMATAVNGKFVSINGQCRVIDYHENGHQQFSDAFDPQRTAKENAEAYEERWSVIPGLQDSLASGGHVAGVVIQNKNDRFHYERHFLPFCTAMEIDPRGGYDPTGLIRAYPYDGPEGHSPEPADVARALVGEIIPKLFTARRAHPEQTA